MGFLVRSINKAKWAKTDAEFPSDAITLCLRTNNNTLSFWFSGDEGSLSDAILAVLASKEYPAAIDIVVIDEEEIGRLDIGVSETPGETAFINADLHRDLIDLDFWQLGYLAEIIVGKLASNEVERITAGGVKRMIREGVEAGTVKFEDLHEKIRSKL